MHRVILERATYGVCRLRRRRQTRSDDDVSAGIDKGQLVDRLHRSRMDPEQIAKELTLRRVYATQGRPELHALQNRIGEFERTRRLLRERRGEISGFSRGFAVDGLPPGVGLPRIEHGDHEATGSDERPNRCVDAIRSCRPVR